MPAVIGDHKVPLVADSSTKIRLGIAVVINNSLMFKSYNQSLTDFLERI